MIKYIFLFLLIPFICFAGVDFTGDADRIALGTIGGADADFTFGTGDFTIAFRIYTHAWGDGASRGVIGAKVNDVSSGWLIYNDGGQPTRIDARLGSSNNFFTSSTVAINTWQHWVLTRSGVDVTWYLNGSLDNTGTNSFDLTLSGNDPCFLAHNDTHGGYFDGIINDVAIWKGTALSADEVSSLYNSKVKGMALQIQPSSLVLYLPLDDYPEGNVITGAWVDRSGSGNGGSGTDLDTDSSAKSEEVLSYP